CFTLSYILFFFLFFFFLFPTPPISTLFPYTTLFRSRYHDVISSFGGKTSYDADNRPLLVMRSNLWASGYDVDGTDQTSLGQFHQDRKSGSAGMPRPISYAVFCLKKKKNTKIRNDIN